MLNIFDILKKRITIDFLYLLALGEDAKNTIPQYLKDYWIITLFTVFQCYILIKTTKLKIFNRTNNLKFFYT